MVCGEMALELNEIKQENERLKQILTEVVDILYDYIEEHHTEDHFYDNWLREHTAELQKLLDD